MCTICENFRPYDSDCAYDALNDVETVTVSATPIYTVDQIASYVNTGYWGAGGQRHFNVAPGGSLTVDLSALTAVGQNLARKALDAWTSVTGITFVEQTGSVDIDFDDENSGAYSSHSYSNGTILSSFVNVNKTWNGGDPNIDSYHFQTYIHEIGHALGLGHAGSYNGSATYGTDNHYTNDSWQMSVMSYFSQYENTSINASFAYVISPMLADILAIQELYGTPTTLSGDTIYGEGANSGLAIDGWLSMSQPVTMTLWDGGGTDLIDLSSQSYSQRIDLTPEAISDVQGLTGNLIVARGVMIENVETGSGNDTITGNDASNSFLLGGGADLAYGGAGFDVIHGEAGNDTLYGGAQADNLYGDAGADTLYGDQGFDRLFGGADSDTLYGGADDDALFGEDGDDWLEGETGNDRLYGGTGNDTLFGGEGADEVNGDAGFDLIHGDAGDDVLNGGAQADNLYGDAGADTLHGDQGADRLFGGADSDTLYGGSDDDALFGESGNDWLDGETGDDRLYGGSGNDTLSGGDGADEVFGDSGFDLIHGDAGDDVLHGGAQADNLYGDAGADTLYGDQGFDRLFGGADSDTLYGGSDNDALFGEDGDDWLEGETGNDRLYGGSGNDTLLGGDGNDVLDGNAGFDRLEGGAGNDTLRGGFNADTFVFADGCGSDTVTDFEATNLYERIDLTGLTAIVDWTDLSTNHLSSDASNCYIDAGGGDFITLLGVSLGDLDAGDFLF